MLKNINLKFKKERKDNIVKNNADTSLILPANTTSLIEMAMDIEIEKSLNSISKSKDVKEIPDLIAKYNTLNLLKDNAINADIDGINSCAIYLISEENKELLISSLIELKNELKIKSKNQDNEFEEMCSKIHNTNILIQIIEDSCIKIYTYTEEIDYNENN